MWEVIAIRDEALAGDLFKNSTRNKYVNKLQGVFTYGIKTRVLRDENDQAWVNPCDNVEKLKLGQPRCRSLTDDEMVRLCDVVSQSKSDGFELAFLILLGTGARKMEVWKLLWNQVDVETGLITLLKTKNGERRVLKVSGNTLNELKKRKLANQPGFD